MCTCYQSCKPTAVVEGTNKSTAFLGWRAVSLKDFIFQIWVLKSKKPSEEELDFADLLKFTDHRSIWIAGSTLPFLTSSYPFEKWSHYEADTYHIKPQTGPAKNKVLTSRRSMRSVSSNHGATLNNRRYIWSFLWVGWISAATIFNNRWTSLKFSSAGLYTSIGLTKGLVRGNEMKKLPKCFKFSCRKRSLSLSSIFFHKNFAVLTIACLLCLKRFGSYSVITSSVITKKFVFRFSASIRAR